MTIFPKAFRNVAKVKVFSLILRELIFILLFDKIQIKRKQLLNKHFCKYKFEISLVRQQKMHSRYDSLEA